MGGDNLLVREKKIKAAIGSRLKWERGFNCFGDKKTESSLFI